MKSPFIELPQDELLPEDQLMEDPVLESPFVKLQNEGDDRWTTNEAHYGNAYADESIESDTEHNAYANRRAGNEHLISLESFETGTADEGYIDSSVQNFHDTAAYEDETEEEFPLVYPAKPGESPFALQAKKQWKRPSNELRPEGWRGRVYGLVVHTSGGSLPAKAIGKKKYPTVGAIDYYAESTGCNYINGWKGVAGGDLVQVANENKMAYGVGMTEQAKSIASGRFEKDLPAAVVDQWKKRWPGYNSPMDLLPGTKTANSCYVHVECLPVVYYLNGKTIIDKLNPPMRAGLRFSKAQHDAIAVLAYDIAARNGWPSGEAWWKTPRLLGHEDLTPYNRNDCSLNRDACRKLSAAVYNKKECWDPGGLRASPYIDWEYIYGRIEAIKKGGYEAVLSSPIKIAPELKDAVQSYSSVFEQEVLTSQENEWDTEYQNEGSPDAAGEDEYEYVSLDANDETTSENETRASSAATEQASVYMSLTAEKQGVIKGNVAQKGREGSIAVYQLRQEMVSPRDGSLGTAAGKRVHKPLVILKEIDSSSTGLLNAQVNNERLKEVMFNFWKPSKSGTVRNFYRIKLTDAFIAGISQNFIPKPNIYNQPMLERLELVYHKIEWLLLDNGASAQDSFFLSKELEEENGSARQGTLGYNSMYAVNETNNFNNDEGEAYKMDDYVANIGNAVRLNDYYAGKLGWHSRHDNINDILLPFSGQSAVSLNQEEFAYALAAWQKAQGFSDKDADGIMGPNTWKLMLRQLPALASTGGTPIEQTEWMASAIIKSKYATWQLYKVKRDAVAGWGVSPPAAYIEAAITEWNSNPGIQRHFDNKFDGTVGNSFVGAYLNLKRLYNAIGIPNAASYFTSNIVPIRFFNRSTPGHLNLRTVLATAQRSLMAAGQNFVFNDAYSFVPRTLRRNINALSNHALGKSIDINSGSNPHILEADDFLVINAVCGATLQRGFLRETDPAVFRIASDHFKVTFTATWIASQTNTTLLNAIRRRRNILNGYAATGFMNLSPVLIRALQSAGATWGGQWQTHKDFMHFDVP